MATLIQDDILAAVLPEAERLLLPEFRDIQRLDQEEKVSLIRRIAKLGARISADPASGDARNAEMLLGRIAITKGVRVRWHRRKFVVRPGALEKTVLYAVLPDKDQRVMDAYRRVRRRLMDFVRKTYGRDYRLNDEQEKIMDAQRMQILLDEYGITDEDVNGRTFIQIIPEEEYVPLSLAS